MERQRVANSEWRVERQRIAGRQRIAISEWRLDKRQQEASRKWRIVSRQSPVANRQSPVAAASPVVNRQSPVATFRLAFTLTELLVAIAILSIMFTLLFIPMTQAFDNARRGRIMAELQNAADYALEIMVRELMQATEVLPQERLHAEDHTYTYPSGRSILHRQGEPLNLLDDLDRFQVSGNQLVDDPSNPNASSDDDTTARIDFVVRAVQGDRLTPQNWQHYTVLTYYLRRSDPSRPFQYLEVGNAPANRRQIFRAHWQPQGTSGTVAPEPNARDARGRWRVTGAWIMPDLSQLQPFNPQQGGLLSHTALTPPDIDVADLRFTVERRPESDERDQKPVAVVIEMTLRKPTPGAKAKGNNPNETDVPSIFVRRRVRVVLPNVP
jgi:prepilin-type N-terminal cleavage/methylation domain-containing protein